MSTAESAPAVPPFGVKATTDLEHRPSGIRARARWIDPQRRRWLRHGCTQDDAAAEAFFNDLLKSSEIGIDRRITFGDYLATIEELHARPGLDLDRRWLQTRSTSARAPALGHVPLSTTATSTAPSTTGRRCIPLNDQEQHRAARTRTRRGRPRRRPPATPPALDPYSSAKSASSSPTARPRHAPTPCRIWPR